MRERAIDCQPPDVHGPRAVWECPACGQFFERHRSDFTPDLPYWWPVLPTDTVVQPWPS